MPPRGHNATSPLHLGAGLTHYCAYNAERPRQRTTLLELNEARARREGAMLLGLPEWLVRVHPIPGFLESARLA